MYPGRDPFGVGRDRHLAEASTKSRDGDSSVAGFMGVNADKDVGWTGLIHVMLRRSDQTPTIQRVDRTVTG
jgi:hypothetical protein